MKTLLTILFLCTLVHSQTVCSEDELIQELKEDIEYNGKLNCLRESYPLPDETPE